MSARGVRCRRWDQRECLAAEVPDCRALLALAGVLRCSGRRVQGWRSWHGRRASAVRCVAAAPWRQLSLWGVA